MKLPVMPPVRPMLAKSVPNIPAGEFSYEPKWDGFRAIVFRDGAEVEIRLPGRFKVSPQIAGAIKAVPGVVQVEAI